MLTLKEYEQIKAAIECMEHYKINGQDYVMQHNVLVLISKFVEQVHINELEKANGSN